MTIHTVDTPSHYSDHYFLPNPFVNTLCFSPYMLPLPLVTSFLVSYFIYFVLFKLLSISETKIHSLGEELELLQSYKPHNQLIEYLTIYWDLPHEICLVIGSFAFDPKTIPRRKNARFRAYTLTHARSTLAQRTVRYYLPQFWNRPYNSSVDIEEFEGEFKKPGYHGKEATIYFRILKRYFIFRWITMSITFIIIVWQYIEWISIGEGKDLNSYDCFIGAIIAFLYSPFTKTTNPTCLCLLSAYYFDLYDCKYSLRSNDSRHKLFTLDISKENARHMFCSL